MPTTAPNAVETHRWTRRQYEQMIDAGIFTEKDRVELINGHIVPASPQSSRYATVVTTHAHVLTRVCPPDHHARSQVPLAHGDRSEPEPDCMIVPSLPSRYTDTHPDTAARVIEAADATLVKDHEQKRHLYAEHETPEYRVVNLLDHRLEVYRDPISGDYKDENNAPGRRRGYTALGTQYLDCR